MTAHLPNLAASMHQRLLNQSKARGMYLFNKWGPTGVADPLKAGS